MRLVIAECSVDYAGRLTAHLPLARRLLLVKADGSVLVHSDGGSYKPLNWMSPPCSLKITELGPDGDGLDGDGHAEARAAGGRQIWTVQHAKSDERLIVHVHAVLHDSQHELGTDPGLVKDGVEAHLQELLAEHVHTLGPGYTLVRREFPTAIGPVDLLVRDADGGSVAVEVKRRGEIDGVEQLSRYLDLLNRDPLLAPVTGVFAAQEIKPQAKVLAGDRGIRCVTLDYDALRGHDTSEHRLF
ncbi:MAG TPA: endonuclease NucS [Kineosporiaceae bacterium]|nr:endonuclease NucS [Kineosporiaceae bacterium]